MNRNLLPAVVLTFVVAISPHDAIAEGLAPRTMKCGLDQLSSPSETREAVVVILKRKAYRCLFLPLNEAKGKPRDEELASILTAFLSETGRVSGGTDDVSEGRVLAIGYLVSTSPGALPPVVDENVQTIRWVVSNSDFEPAQQVALAVLSVRRSDQDVPVFLAAIESNVDGLLPYAFVGLTNSCSPVAQEALRRALRGEATRRYLSRYAGKETISATIKRRCPAALAE